MKVIASLLSLLVILISAAPATQPVPRPAIITAKEWGSVPQPIADVRRQIPQWITIHHAGVLWTARTTPEKFVRNMQAWGQKEKNWPDLPYHFLIAPDGRIFEGRPIIYEPESNTKYELQGNIGVEMMGDFEQQRPSVEQLNSCVKLVAWLAEQHHIGLDHIRGHKDAAPGQTSCPGRDFYRYLESGQFKKWIEELSAGKNVKIEPGAPLPQGPTTNISEWPILPATNPNDR